MKKLKLKRIKKMTVKMDMDNKKQVKQRAAKVEKLMAEGWQLRTTTKRGGLTYVHLLFKMI